MIYIYDVILTLLFIMFSPVIGLILIFNKKWRESLPERFGIFDGKCAEKLKGKNVVWFHAASAGEVQALAPVIMEFKAMNPGSELLVTTTSVNGKKKIQKELADTIACAFLLPLDLSIFIRPLINRVKPAALVIVETELWPNFLHYTAKTGAPVIMINGRISVKSFRFYYSFRFFFKKVLVHFHTLIVQSEKMVKRLSRLGVEKSRMIILNNTKYSFEANGKAAAKFAVKDKKGKKIIVAGSIREGEEEFVLDGFEMSGRKDALLIIAPRHLNRVPVIESILKKKAMKYCLWNAVKDYSTLPDYDCVIVNTIGDLSYIYLTGDIAIIGGGFKEFGGHNPMEAAVAGLPIIMGRNMFNFEDTAEKFLKDGGAYRVETPGELSEKLKSLLANDGQRSYDGEKNKHVIENYRGSASTTAMLIKEILIDKTKE